MAAGLLPQLASTGNSGVVRIVQWCVIALIFLFFLRVIRAVWVEVRPAGPRHGLSNPRPMADSRPTAGPPPRRGKAPLYLEVVEPSDRAGQRFDVAEELTIGRSPGCEVATTYDIYSSTLHARLRPRDGRLSVEDLGSTNGTFVNSERITKPTKLGRGDLVQVGATVFEVTR
ncbi:MAG: FHA domain-containing protein [Acidimicrobiales bacterium]